MPAIETIVAGELTRACGYSEVAKPSAESLWTWNGEPMKLRFGSHLSLSASALVVLCVTCMPAVAQSQGSAKTSAIPQLQEINALPKGGPAPRTADGHPDLSGVWFPGVTGDGNLNDAGLAGDYTRARQSFDRKKTPEAPYPFQPWAAAKYKEMYPSDVEIQLHSPAVNCAPRGVPAMFVWNPYPIQLVTTPGQFVQLNEMDVDFRVVPTDGRPHTKDPDPSFHGDAVGHWEGDTLVIDVIAIDERTWNNRLGWFHSDAEHVIERITRPSMNYLVYQVTIEDPKVLTKPWTSPPYTFSLGHEPLQEFYCTHTEELSQFSELKKKKEE
jgi:hypothetical protein